MINYVEFLNQDQINRLEKLGIDSREFTEQFVRGSGKGGQKINKTSSCVLLQHEPTGLDVRMQKHRELQNNRRSAWKLMLEKLEVLKLGKASPKNIKMQKLRKQKQKRYKKAVLKIVGNDDN